MLWTIPYLLKKTAFRCVLLCCLDFELFYLTIKLIYTERTNLPEAKKVHFQKSKVETVLITFFDSKDVVRRELVSRGKIVNSAFYMEVNAKGLLTKIKRVGAAVDWPTSLVGLFCALHTELKVKSFLAAKNFI